MTTIGLEHQTTASANAYIRVLCLSGSDVGKVLDFSDNAWKALASATTPFSAATERADFGGTGVSGYTVELDLSEVNSTAEQKNVRVKWYDNGTPVDGDAVIDEEEVMFVRFSELGYHPVYVQTETSVTSTAGSVAHVNLWLEYLGQKMDLTGATCSVTIREMNAGVNTFTLTEADGSITNDILQLSKTTPGFTADRQHEVAASITLDGVTFTSPDAVVIIG